MTQSDKEFLASCNIADWNEKTPPKQPPVIAKDLIDHILGNQLIDERFRRAMVRYQQRRSI